ncbi:hypothetical protein V865_005744 [Kwoniella europaea PYCC6329]|uniref:Sister chromatid cohesion protein PDS5 n=1 Tax=Kwoniella europaea PYCC6329 TaxID=1423913 RepID=A0AAX4KQL4_9TREE
MPRASETERPLVKLDFKEQLIQSGKRDTTDALLKRIKTLHQKLSALEQDGVDVRSLDSVRKPLIKDTILHHKDRGVKAYAACCLADLLRLYAPDAPYSESQLRDIFAFFLQTQTQTQRVTDIPYYTEYYHLIESLATIKSIALICDVPESDTLTEGFFTGFLNIIRPDMNKTLIRHLRDILVSLIEEAHQIPQGVMDCLISQFENYASRPEVLSFQLTVDVCNQVADRLKRPIYAHFSEIQASHGRDPSNNDMKIITESHELLLTIYKFCPDLLLNVVPLLEDNLKVRDEDKLRQLSVKTLGAIFAQRPGAEDPARKYPSAWRAWLGRKVDKALPVRLAWVEATKEVLVNHPEVRLELQGNLIERVEDSDERVRAGVCKIIGALDYETALHHITSATLQAINGRMSDKKSSVRTEAANALAKLWNLAYSEIESNNADAIKQFAWIPEAILGSTRRGGTLESRWQLASIFKNSILPLPTDANDEQAWVDRLIFVTSRLNDDALLGLKIITGLPEFAQGNLPFKAFVQACEDYNGGVIADGGQDAKARLNFIIDAMARSYFGDVDKAKRDLHAFAASNEARLFKLYKTCVDVQSNLSSIIKARNELLRKVHQAHDDLLQTITSLVDISTWNIINQSSIPPLIRRISKPESEASSTAAAKILAIIAKEGAPMFKNYTGQLTVAMMDKKNDKLVELALQALSAVCKIYPEVAPAEHRPVERATTVALEGTQRQAKFAARFLARSKEPQACEKLVASIVKGFNKTSGTEQLLTHLRALTELALSKPQAIQSKSVEIMTFIMNEVILAPSPSADIESGDEWVEIEELEPLDRAKILGLKFLTHRCLAFARDEEAEKILKPVLSLLISILDNEGMINENTKEGGFARCHLRLQASTCLLKLANARVYDRAMARQTQFDVVVGVIQDACYMVRHLYLKKLNKVLPTQRLSPRWNITPVMIAMDPETENVVAGRGIMQKIVVACTNFPTFDKVERIEMPLARLLHFLAHHPDLHWTDPEEGGEEGISDQQNLKDMASFIELYLDCVANRDNIGLLYAIAQGLKGIRDRVGDNSKPLWTLAELAQVIIKNRADKHAWSIPIYPGHLKWPKDIFHHAENLEDKQKVQRTQYLSEEVRNWARGLGRRNINPVSQPVRKVENTNTSPSNGNGNSNKRKSSSTRTKKTPKKRRRIEESEDEDQDSEDEDESDEDGDESGSGSEQDEDEDMDEEGEDVLGRGGRRGAKTKARRAVAGKKKSKKSKSKKEDDDSDLTDLSD